MRIPDLPERVFLNFLGVIMSSEMEQGSSRDDFSDVYKDFEFLRLTLSENRAHLKNEVSQTANQIDEIFGDMLSTVDEAKISFKYVETRAHEFDLDQTTKANGHWSTLLFARKLTRQVRKTVEVFATRKNSWFFNKENYLRDIRYISGLFVTITSSLNICKEIIVRSEDGNLFLNETHSFKELLDEFGRFNQYVLFGQFNSTHLSKSIRPVIRLITCILTTYSEWYYSDGRLLRALRRCIKMVTDENERAMRLVVISQYASYRFFKAFASLSERGLLGIVAKWHDTIMLPVSLNKTIMLPPTDSLTIETVKEGNSVEIPAPMSHIGPSSLPVRLISKTRRFGMEDRTRGRPLSDELVIHFHGGGFICHTSRSHEVYLRRWAQKLECPVVSVDYSLSPEVPYPRPLEEAFYAYCYALKYPEKFGSTGGKIVLAGDSAGGVLVMNVLLKAIQYNIRPPDGAVMIYTPFQLAPVISPGRFLTFLDPILSIGFVAASVKCYLNKVNLLSRYDIQERKMKENVVQLKNLVAGNHKYGLAGKGDDKRKVFLDSETEFRQNQQQPRRGFRARLFRRKTSIEETELKYEMRRDAFNPTPFCLDDFEYVPKDPFLSPILASDDVIRRLPPVSLLVNIGNPQSLRLHANWFFLSPRWTADYDPFVDDNIDFAKRLKCLGVKTNLQVLEGLNHGFLNMCMLSGVARKGSDMCCQLIIEHLRK